MHTTLCLVQAAPKEPRRPPEEKVRSQFFFLLLCNHCTGPWHASLICCTASRGQSTGKATGQLKNNKLRNLGSKLTKSMGSDSEKRQAGGEATDGLLVQCKPTKRGEKVKWVKDLPLTVWCCKFAFSMDK